MGYTLGIDIGTFETKGVLVDEAGAIVAEARRGHKMLVPEPGWAEHRPEEDWWEDLCHVAQSVIAQSGVDPAQIDALAPSAIGPCMLPVDAGGMPLMNGVLYGVDTRAEAEIAWLNETLGEQVILERCGNALTSQSVGPKVLWLKRQRPEIFAKTDKILTSTSFLVHRLTGEYVIDHYTAASFSPLYDIHRQEWSAELSQEIIELGKLPRLCWSTQIAGTITKEAAKATGLAVGTPVTVGTIDAAAEAISVGLRHDGDLMAMYGSTIFMIMCTAKPVRDPRLWGAPWLFEGEHASMAGLATSGTLTHWFRDHFAKDLDPDTAFATLARESAQSPPGARGLILLPYFSGERTPIHDPLAKGCFFGLNLTHTRGDLYRAVIEGICYGTRHVTDTYGEIGQKVERLLAVGGGTKNALWLEATSHITGLDQEVREKTIGASYGDAFLAALALGKCSREDIDAWNPVARRVEARADPRYEHNYAIFRKLYTATKELMGEL